MGAPTSNETAEAFAFPSSYAASLKSARLKASLSRHVAALFSLTCVMAVLFSYFISVSFATVLWFVLFSRICVYFFHPDLSLETIPNLLKFVFYALWALFCAAEGAYFVYRLIIGTLSFDVLSDTVFSVILMIYFFVLAYDSVRFKKNEPLILPSSYHDDVAASGVGAGNALYHHQAQVNTGSTGRDCCATAIDIILAIVCLCFSIIIWASFGFDSYSGLKNAITFPPQNFAKSSNGGDGPTLHYWCKGDMSFDQPQLIFLEVCLNHSYLRRLIQFHDVLMNIVYVFCTGWIWYAESVDVVLHGRVVTTYESVFL